MLDDLPSIFDDGRSSIIIDDHSIWAVPLIIDDKVMIITDDANHRWIIDDVSKLKKSQLPFKLIFELPPQVNIKLFVVFLHLDWETTIIVETLVLAPDPGATTQKELSRDGAGVRCLTAARFLEL